MVHPAIKKEITVLYEERQRVLEDLPITQAEQKGKTLLETAVHIDKKVKQYEQTNTICK